MQRSRIFATQRRLFSQLHDRDVVVCGFARTPIGKMGGGLASKTAPQLGAIAIAEAVKRSGINKDHIEEAFMGNVVSAGVGQAPTRQAVIYAGLKLDTPSTTINKVCASGMKSAMFAATSISSGYRNVILAGGMESMSNIPYYLPQARNGYRLGNGQVIDGLVHDGLWDVYNNQHMGMCGEACATKYGITRKDQDDFAIRSYARAQEAWAKGKFANEVVAVSIEGRKGDKPTIVDKDEEFNLVKLDKLATLRPAFKKDGTVTAANASKLNDGAAAMIVVSGKYAKEHNLKPLFKIRGYGDAARDPVEFTIAPADAVPRALKHAGLQASDIQYHEINEAFSVVAIANAQ
jgi:acetyl-CoA C-acetyltransferase